MPCYYPLEGWKSKNVNESGKRSVVFKRSEGFEDMPVRVPCGQCHGCRLERSRQWALRCVHEAQLHDQSSFITLTYDDEHLPEGATLVKRDFQLFMKRLRKALHPIKIRYFMCGEYGENAFQGTFSQDKRRRATQEKHLQQYKISALGRPHYHAIIFGYDFPDREYLETRNGNHLFYSPMLEQIWDKGFNTIGNVTFESAAYVARYVMKKINGEESEMHYTRLDPDTGELIKVEPEYTTMSRKPGIASDWYDKYKEDCFPKDFVTVRGMKLKPPKFYSQKLEVEDDKLASIIKSRRRANAKAMEADNTLERLRAKEKVKLSKLQFLNRGLNQ